MRLASGSKIIRSLRQNSPKNSSARGAALNFTRMKGFLLDFRRWLVSCGNPWIGPQTFRVHLQSCSQQIRASLGSINFWNGDQWLNFMTVSTFVLEPVMKRDSTLRKHIARRTLRWPDMHRWTTMLGLTSMQSCMCLNKPGCSDPQLGIGPVLLSTYHSFKINRSRHKHLFFRGFIERSNKKNVEKWSLEREQLVATIRYQFPDVKIRNHYGQIINIVDKTYYLQTFSIDQAQQHRLTKCALFTTFRKCHVIQVERDSIVGRFSVVDGFVNRYEVLDMLHV